MPVHAGGVGRCPRQGAVGWFGLCPLCGTNQVRKLAPPSVRSSGMATQSLPDCCPVLASSLWCTHHDHSVGCVAAVAGQVHAGCNLATFTRCAGGV